MYFQVFIEKYTNHKCLGLWLFTKWSHLSNQHQNYKAKYYIHKVLSYNPWLLPFVWLYFWVCLFNFNWFCFLPCLTICEKLTFASPMFSSLLVKQKVFNKWFVTERNNKYIGEWSCMNNLNPLWLFKEYLIPRFHLSP